MDKYMILIEKILKKQIREEKNLGETERLLEKLSEKIIDSKETINTISDELKDVNAILEILTNKNKSLKEIIVNFSCRTIILALIIAAIFGFISGLINMPFIVPLFLNVILFTPSLIGSVIEFISELKTYQTVTKNYDLKQVLNNKNQLEEFLQRVNAQKLEMQVQSMELTQLKSEISTILEELNTYKKEVIAKRNQAIATVLNNTPSFEDALNTEYNKEENLNR